MTVAVTTLCGRVGCPEGCRYERAFGYVNASKEGARREGVVVGVVYVLQALGGAQCVEGFRDAGDVGGHAYVVREVFERVYGGCRRDDVQGQRGLLLYESDKHPVALSGAVPLSRMILCYRHESLGPQSHVSVDRAGSFFVRPSSERDPRCSRRGDEDNSQGGVAVGPDVLNRILYDGDEFLLGLVLRTRREEATDLVVHVRTQRPLNQENDGRIRGAARHFELGHETSGGGRRAREDDEVHRGPGRRRERHVWAALNGTH